MKPRDIRKQYSPTVGPHGASTSKNIASWSGRASANSLQHSFAPANTSEGGTKRNLAVPSVPPTGGSVKLHSTNEAPRSKRHVDRKMVDSHSYMPGVRRTIGGR